MSLAMSSSSSPSIFARLPGELLCDVFEHAALSRSSALVLSLVSTWVRILVQPYLYHTVVLASARSLRAFLAALASKPAAFASAHVRNLGIFAMGPAQSIIEVMEQCKGARSLACGFFVPGCKGAGLMSPTTDLTRVQALECTQEQHLLGMACRDGWDARVVGSSVTRLRVHLPASSMSHMFPDPAIDPLRPENEGEAVGWERLAQLPNLTHLAIVYRPSERYPIEMVFEHLLKLVSPPDPTAPLPAAQEVGLTQPQHTIQLHPNLHLILLQVVSPSTGPSPSIPALNALAQATGGPALQIVAERAPMSAAVQWEEAVRAGRTVWEGAEEEVARRVKESDSKRL